MLLGQLKPVHSFWRQFFKKPIWFNYDLWPGVKSLKSLWHTVKSRCNGKHLHYSKRFVFSSLSQLVQLENLFAYWNVNSVLFSNHTADEALVSLPNKTLFNDLNILLIFCYFLSYCFIVGLDSTSLLYALRPTLQFQYSQYRKAFTQFLWNDLGRYWVSQVICKCFWGQYRFPWPFISSIITIFQISRKS